MESKLSKRYDHLMKRIESDIESKKKHLEIMTRELKEAVAKYDTYSIVTFVPGQISRIEELDREIKTLEEKQRMLVWLGNED